MARDVTQKESDESITLQLCEWRIFQKEATALHYVPSAGSPDYARVV